jgi:hypothetical protein
MYTFRGGVNVEIASIMLTFFLLLPSPCFSFFLPSSSSFFLLPSLSVGRTLRRKIRSLSRRRRGGGAWEWGIEGAVGAAADNEEVGEVGEVGEQEAGGAGGAAQVV